MLIDIKVPPLSESVSTATLLAWEKGVGEAIRRDENLINIETDKVILEIPAPADGVLVEVLQVEGASVISGEVIARIDTAGKASAVVADAPPARPVPLPPPTAAAERAERRVPMSHLRQRVAERLLQAQAQNVILTTFNEINMAPVMALRQQHKARYEQEYGVRLGFMSFFVKAVVAALKTYPILNASIDGTDVVYHDYFDIGIAVGSARGLVVPVLRNADQMSLLQIEQKIAEFSTRASEGKLGIDELSGGSFSITNGGVFGSMLSTPIINPPQAAILGIHATRDRPVVENGEIVIRPINYFALSYDHRLIDGREAVLGLVAIKKALENPAQLMED